MSFWNVREKKSMVQLGRICLVVGLGAPMVIHPVSQAGRNWLHAACGFMLGLSITVMLMTMRRSRRCCGGE
ncbi:MAG: hypothetical protein ABSD13_15475 [Candidatus Korobacteraceae bacterium]|jgi:hypothetical protein